MKIIVEKKNKIEIIFFYWVKRNTNFGGSCVKKSETLGVVKATLILEDV